MCNCCNSHAVTCTVLKSQTKYCKIYFKNQGKIIKIWKKGRKTGSVNMHKAPQEFTILEAKYSICIYSYIHVLLHRRKVNRCVYASLSPINITSTHNVQIKIVLWWTKSQRLKHILQYAVFQTTKQRFSWYNKTHSRYKLEFHGNFTQDNQCLLQDSNRT